MRTLSLALVFLTPACSGLDCEREPIVDEAFTRVPYGEELRICPGDLRMLFDPTTQTEVVMRQVGLHAPHATLIEHDGGDQRLRFGLDGKVTFKLDGYCGPDGVEPEDQDADWLELSVDEGHPPATVVLKEAGSTDCL